MSNVYTKNLSGEIYFLNDKNVVLEIDVSGVINPIASHLLVKNISVDVANYIEKTDLSIETILSDISSLLQKDLEIITNIDKVKSELISNIISTSNELSTYSDERLSSISSLIDTKINNISSKVAVAYRPMGSVSSYLVLEEKLSKYLSSEEPISSHIGEVWNVIGEVSSELGVVETGNNYVFVKVSDGNGYRYEWDDIGGIVDLSKYALSSDVSDLVTTLSKNISDYINSVSTDVSNTVESSFVHISGDTINGNLKVNSLTSVTDINAKTLYIGSTVKIEETKVALGNSNTTYNGQFVWNGIVSNEYNPPSAYGTFNINPSASINGIIVGTESLSSIISSVILTSSEQVSNLVTGTISTVSSKITSLLDENKNTLYNTISNVETISNDVLEIKDTSIPNINENISNISTNVSTLSTNVNIALEQVLKTVEFAGHVTFSSHDDAVKRASTLSDLLHNFNITEKSRIKNGAMYHVEFTISSDKIPADELALYYVDVKIAENSYVRISHGDYIIFHDDKTKQFIDISSITKENIYVTEVSFSDLYSLSATASAKIKDLSNTVSRDYAYLSGNNIDNGHALSGRHDFIGSINVTDLSAENISVEVLSAETLSTLNLSANEGKILTTIIDEAIINLANISTLYSDNISVENELSAEHIKTPSASITSATITQLTSTSATIDNISVDNILSAKYVKTPSANISSANLLTVNISSELCVNFGNVFDTNKNQSLSTQINTLSTAIDNKIHIGNATEISSSDLIVRKLTNEEYAEKLNNNKISSNTIYIIEDDYVDAYGQIISNATNSNIQEILTSYAHISAISSNFTGPSEAATVKLVSALTIGKVGALSDSLSTTIGTLNNSLISAISSKIYIQDPTVPELSDGKYNVDLSVIKLTPDEYIEKLTKDEIKDTALYVLCSDYVDSFGQIISNAVNSSTTYKNGLSGFIEEELLEATSNSLAAKESEAATVEYVNAIVNARITNSYNRIYNALNEI